ncbi:MAG: GreA/GreB family elongation factor [Chitinophagaceae bacterium]|nr:GreA/GreB family elongation factor [Chitinophagaceae bacterium]
MNTKQLNPVVLTEEDYRLLKPYAGSSLPGSAEEMSLAYELSRAVIVAKDAFPKHGIRLNSRVSVLDMDTQKVLEFTIVMPEHAAISQQKISVLTPMGAALIGFRKGEEVQWKVPAGLKRFRILDVVNL